ncbi:MAG: hypothetical protein KAJ51_08445 [Thermoplasmata archaeon]|nr:hypothetical protein [Thermoplasmata archaeon]
MKISVIILFVILIIVIFATLATTVLSPPQRNWWVNYPEGHVEASQGVEHPTWILDELDEYKAIVLFFWQVGCGPCETQWDDMKDEGLVKGTINGGALDRYSDQAKLYSLDINADAKYRDAMYTYDPQGQMQGTPTTVILTKLSDGDIGWYSYKGIMDVEDLDYYIDNAVNSDSYMMITTILVLAIIVLIVIITVLVVVIIMKRKGYRNSNGQIPNFK